MRKADCIRETRRLVALMRELDQRDDFIRAADLPPRVRTIRLEYIAKQMQEVDKQLELVAATVYALKSAGMWGRRKNVQRQRSMRSSSLPQAVKA